MAIGIVNRSGASEGTLERTLLLTLSYECTTMSQPSHDFQTTSKGKDSAVPDLASEQGTLVEESVSETLGEVQVHLNTHLVTSLIHCIDIGATRGGRRAQAGRQQLIPS